MLMRNIVDGYWRKNLGDDLFLKILAERYPNNKFYILIDKEFYSVFDEFKNIVPIFNKKSALMRLKGKIGRLLVKIGISLPGTVENKILKCSNYIELGGSIFIMNTSKMDNSYSLRKMISCSKVNHYIIGSNFGPYKTEGQLQRYQSIMEKCLWVSFRDEYSLTLFRNDANNLHWFPDVVFCLNVNNYIKSKEYILISVINPEGRCDGSEYEDWLLGVIKNYINNENEKIVLMCFCEFQGDQEFANKLYNELNNSEKNNIKIVVHKDIDESMNVICKAKKVIATRFHAMILAWLLEKPVFVISYSNKTTDVIHCIAPEQKYTNINELTSDIKIEYSEFDTGYFDKTIELAKKHFAGLDKAYSHEN